MHCLQYAYLLNYDTDFPVAISFMVKSTFYEFVDDNLSPSICGSFL